MGWRSMHDEEAFVALVARESGALMRTAYLLCYDLHEAEDLVQETWTRLARRWQRSGGLDNPGGYARRILVNAAIDSQPARGRRRRELATDEALIEPPDAASVRALRAVDDQDELARAMAGLTRRQRAVLVLRYFDDLPEQRVAELLGCSVGTVKSTASKALASLRTDLATNDPPRPVDANADHLGETDISTSTDQMRASTR